MSENQKIIPGQHGGFRPGAGRKPKSKEIGSVTENPHHHLAVSKAKREFFKAQMAEVEYGIRSKELYERGEVLRVIRTAVAVFAEQMRSLPDQLERSVGLTPTQAELAEDEVNTQLTELQNRLAEVLRDE